MLRGSPIKKCSSKTASKTIGCFENVHLNQWELFKSDQSFYWLLYWYTFSKETPRRVLVILNFICQLLPQVCTCECTYGTSLPTRISPNQSPQWILSQWEATRGRRGGARPRGGALSFSSGPMCGAALAPRPLSSVRRRAVRGRLLPLRFIPTVS